ncbi:MAG: hypothetical protein EOO07_11750 [Chitinophagaceae bacterium]|nr:MAG: hypothetical protein EOO07_11750 [Chitinophagaceae bacterium]
MTDVVVEVEGIYANISPDAFHMWATHYFKCWQQFEKPSSFSPIPYFLLCRTMELAIKSIHLKSKRQSQVKAEYGHKILEAYNALEGTLKTLTQDEYESVVKASPIYNSKGFEYFNPEHALQGYSNFPDLDSLSSATIKILSLFSNNN